jgi:hypothetical protein
MSKRRKRPEGGVRAMKRIITFVCLSLFMAVGSSFAREVPINPITPDIRAKLKESTELIGKVEDKLAPRVKEMEKVFRTYRETCKGGGNDRGVWKSRINCGSAIGRFSRI